MTGDHRIAGGAASLDLAGPHWRFALAVYGRPGVAEACLLLQDSCGVDVNVLLVALFSARAGRPLSPSGIAAADAAIARWREEVVRPLRVVRRAMKSEAAVFGGDGEMVRNRVKAAELAAEQLEQAVLAGAVAAMAPGEGPADSAAVIRAVVAFYSAGADDPAAAALEQAVARIAEAADAVPA
ncbi:TIGR02444 family protein [Faunimonas sp. B44]|uniref:TIGR02444 family protein n=1 Tax=Faunimonas sp. B44 TaxID=3461493 RepID=UPI004044B362